MEPTLQVRRIEVFDRVVCAVDASAAGLDAARIAARATDPEGRLVLVTVEDPSIAVHAGWAAPRVLEQLVLEAQTASRDAQAQAGRIHAVETRLRKAIHWPCCTRRSPATRRPSSSSAVAACEAFARSAA